MKKYHYSSYGNNVIPFDTHQSSASIKPIYQNKEINRWNFILEKRTSESSKQQEELLSKYKNSLNKKRLIRVWEKNRAQVNIAPMLPAIIEKVIYQNVYVDTIELICTCYYEDFDLPLTEITLYSWLKQLHAVAEKMDKEWDMVYWQEMIDFLKQCKKSELLNLSQLSVNKQK
jgi:hypothetical protein